jgi:hypothetical protein
VRAGYSLAKYESLWHSLQAVHGTNEPVPPLHDPSAPDADDVTVATDGDAAAAATDPTAFSMDASVAADAAAAAQVTAAEWAGLAMPEQLAAIGVSVMPPGSGTAPLPVVAPGAVDTAAAVGAAETPSVPQAPTDVPSLQQAGPAEAVMGALQHNAAAVAAQAAAAAASVAVVAAAQPPSADEALVPVATQATEEDAAPEGTAVAAASEAEAGAATDHADASLAALEPEAAAAP